MFPLQFSVFPPNPIHSFDHNDQGFITFLQTTPSLQQDSSENDAGVLVEHMGWSLLFPFDLPKFFQLVLAYYFCILYQDFLFNVTHTSGSWLARGGGFSPCVP